MKFKKHSNTRISAHFVSSEFECPCNHPSCVDQEISDSLIKKLEDLRVEFDLPISINSGYRCAEKQQDLRDQGYETATGKSTHELGKAVDIRPTDLSNMKDLGKLLPKYFKAIGTAKTFFHVDERDDKERRWSYSAR